MIGGLELNADKIKYRVMSGDQSAGRRHSMKTDNGSFERVEDFKYSWKTLARQTCVQEEIKSRLQSGNACCHLVQNITSSGLLYKNIQTEIYRTVMLGVKLGRSH